MAKCVAPLLLWVAFVLLPTAVLAQATIAGVVRDTSGAVLPGVTVEAASPVLIEKVRSVVTDGTGQFRIVDLRPGTYTVTFTLPGFNTVRREMLELTGSFTATVNADMRVGALEETITVNAETPVVDLQGVTQQQVLSKEVVDAIPTGRYLLNLGVLVPGVSISTGFGGVSQDVGGNVGEQMQTLAIHGSRGNDGRMTLDGLSVADSMGSGSTTGFVPNMASAQEVVVDTGAVSAEQPGGGVRINIIPREGGNRYSGTVFLNGMNSSMQSDNLDADLQARGLSIANGVKKVYDFNPAVGGPIVRDRVWFYSAFRRNGNDNWTAGMFFNRNEGNPNAWTYDPDRSRQAFLTNRYRSQNIRLTVQANQKNKLSFFYDNQNRESHRVTATTSPEAASRFWEPIVAIGSATWSSPLTSRLLVEAGFQRSRQGWGNKNWGTMIGVTSQAEGIAYRSPAGGFPFSPQSADNIRASVSYVTGSHSFKVGMTDRWLYNRSTPSDYPWFVSYRVNNLTEARPNQITQRAPINWSESSTKADWAVYAQDRWTIDRLTLNLAIRLEGLVTRTTEGCAGPSLFAPNRDICFDAQPWGNQKDVTPRLGASYDLFGTGKTALKTTLNKYISAAGLSGFNPLGGLSTSITRTWGDDDRDYVPDCDLMVLTANGECGIASSLSFGSVTLTNAPNIELFQGWGKREFNWEYSLGVQHELLPRMSVDVSYFRRWYGNFTVTDNLLTSVSDYTPYSVVAPADARLPGGGGQTITGLVDVVPAFQGRTSNQTKFAKDFGRQLEHWNGVDVTTDVRLESGVLLQGGLSTGRTSTDNCEVLAALPEAISAATPAQFCERQTPFLTQFKALGAYTVPRINLAVAATFQSLPGPEELANVVYSNAQIAPWLGRNLAAGTNANVTVGVVEPGTMFGERLNQLDLRFSRRINIAASRLTLSFDLYNALNANPVTAQNNNFATWLVPTTILDARVMKVGFQYDF